MMKIPIRVRLALALTATVVLGTGGYFIGQSAGLVVATRLAQGHLKHAANVALDDSIAFSRDAHNALDGVAKSPYKPCSRQDLDYLHNLLHHSYLTMEIGRLSNERVICSTDLGNARLADTVFPDKYSLGVDGVKVYRDPPNFKVPLTVVTVLRKGDQYAVLNPFINILRDNSQEHLFATVLGPHPNPPYPLNEFSQRPNQKQLTSNGVYRIGDALYVTQCSAITNVCETAVQTEGEIATQEAVHIRLSAIFGAVLGAMLAMLISLELRQSQGLKRQLRRAIRKDLIRVVYQPVVEIATGRVVAAEALARWTDEDGTEIPPDIFIRVAEEAGFVGEITRLVLRHILRDFLKSFQAHPEFCVNMNVTASDLNDPGFPIALAETLRRTNVAPSRIGIEITETGSVGGTATLEAIYLLQQRGHRVLIDDFGTGYSSLSYLHQLNPHTIKIDKSFTRAIGTHAVTEGILPQIMAMAERLGLKVIAEGVETEKQNQYYADQEKDLCAQGWHFGYPMPAEEIRQLIDGDVRLAQDSVTL